MKTYNTKDYLFHLLSLLIVFGFVFFVLDTFMLRIDSYIQYQKDKLRLTAINDCGKVAQFEKTLDKENTKIISPLEDVYKQCLKDKGIE